MIKEREMIKLEQSIRNIFEHELGRLMSPMEIEFLEEWKSQGFTDAIIRDALKQAIYNGATASSYKYINKILQNWKSAEQASNVMTNQKQETANATAGSVQDDDLPWLD